MLNLVVFAVQLCLVSVVFAGMYIQHSCLLYSIHELAGVRPSPVGLRGNVRFR